VRGFGSFPNYLAKLPVQTHPNEIKHLENPLGGFGRLGGLYSSLICARTRARAHMPTYTHLSQAPVVLPTPTIPGTYGFAKVPIFGRLGALYRTKPRIHLMPRRLFLRGRGSMPAEMGRPSASMKSALVLTSLRSRKNTTSDFVFFHPRRVIASEKPRLFKLVRRHGFRVRLLHDRFRQRRVFRNVLLRPHDDWLKPSRFESASV
jgi:hypothetical protein